VILVCEPALIAAPIASWAASVKSLILVESKDGTSSETIARKPPTPAAPLGEAKNVLAALEPVIAVCSALVKW